MENNSYLNYLKSISNNDNGEVEYPNIQDFFITDNFLIYKNFKLDLNGIKLAMLDPILFTFEINEILFILKNNVINFKDPNFIQKEINYMLYLENLIILTDEQKKYIYDYLNDFYKKNNIRKQYNYSELNNELEARIIPINQAYLKDDEINSEYYKPAANFIRELELAYYNNENATNTIKYSNQLVRTNNSLPLGLYDTDSFREAGFAHNIIIIVITILIGFLLALTLFFIK